MAEAAPHEPVLLEEVERWLAPEAGARVLDCTLGAGGHAARLGARLGSEGLLVGLDVDPASLEAARPRLEGLSCRVTLRRGNFSGAAWQLRQLGLDGVDAVLADLGFASLQMADPERGLSFDREGPLDMRLDPQLPRTAADLIREMPQKDLAALLQRYGEEPAARAIAQKIVEERAHRPIQTTAALSRLVEGTTRKTGRADAKPHPATRTFQALRIAVNGELEALERLLGLLPRLLRPGGRAGIIAFHSLEDRRVKQAFARAAQRGTLEVVTTRPVSAGPEEQQRNPRSRSARLRVARAPRAEGSGGGRAGGGPGR
jgi:16S rRNA (cytosine1402-N4)-methyltransferase